MDRHDLVYLTARGREQAIRYADVGAQRTCGHEVTEQIVEHCPGIVTQQSFSNTQHGYLRLGYSWYERCDGVRMRFATMADRTEALRAVKPWELVQHPDRLDDGRLRSMLCRIRAAGERYGLKWGVFGSCAMELATGLPYTDEHSDLDLIVVREDERAREGGDCAEMKGGCGSSGTVRLDKALCSFYEECTAIAGNIRLDMEILLPGTGSVKAAEWFSQSETLLVKSLDGARVVDRAEIESIGI